MYPVSDISCTQCIRYPKYPVSDVFDQLFPSTFLYQQFVISASHSFTTTEEDCKHKCVRVIIETVIHCSKEQEFTHVTYEMNYK